MQPIKTGQRLIRHLEQYLGPISVGWKTNPDGVLMPFQVAKFDQTPFRGSVGYCTIGLSSHDLECPLSKRSLRLEFVLLVREDSRSLGIPNTLQTVGVEMLRSGVAVLRGNIIGPRGRLWPNSIFEGLYSTSPAYLPDGFADCELEDGRKCALVWLVPISRRECTYIASLGWAAFERALVDENPDLLAPDRGEMAATAGYA